MGAYSHGLKVDIGDSEMIFVTGQIAMDANGKPVAPDNITDQTKYVFENIEKILKEGGASLDDIVKVTIYVTNMDDFKEISTVRNKYLANAKATSTLVEINRTVTNGCDIEIEAIALRKK